MISKEQFQKMIWLVVVGINGASENIWRLELAAKLTWHFIGRNGRKTKRQVPKTLTHLAVNRLSAICYGHCSVSGFAHFSLQCF
jgi:hypothetical protein